MFCMSIQDILARKSVADISHCVPCYSFPAVAVAGFESFDPRPAARQPYIAAPLLMDVLIHVKHSVETAFTTVRDQEQQQHP